MSALYPRVLFFISGTTPTPLDLQEANDYGPGVAFRNALMVPEDGPIEDADAVAGAAPQRYIDALPSVKDREKVYKRMSLRNPGNATMFGGPVAKTPYDELTDEQRATLNANDLSRGSKPLPVNERVGAPLPVNARRTQSGTLHVPDAMQADGWTTSAKAEPAGDAAVDPATPPAGETDTKPPSTAAPAADETSTKAAAAKAKAAAPAT